MEFLRFGSSIPGSYWGCCAMDIIQNFKVDPDAPYAIQIVDGDSCTPVGGFVGMTYKEVFLQRIKFGTFSTNNMPNHGFLAILTDWQVKSGVGAKWLAILKECGFEFIRTVSNSVYTGQQLGAPGNSNLNYVFGLIRNIGKGGAKNPFMPPKEWTKLPKVIDEAWELFDKKADANYAASIHEQQTALYKKLPDPVFYTQAQIEAKGIHPAMAGKRSRYPQEPLSSRQAKEQEDQKVSPKAPTLNPFS